MVSKDEARADSKVVLTVDMLHGIIDRTPEADSADVVIRVKGTIPAGDHVVKDISLHNGNFIMEI